MGYLGDLRMLWEKVHALLNVLNFLLDAVDQSGSGTSALATFICK